MGPFAGRAGDARSSGQLLKLPEAKERILVPAIQSYFIEPIWEQFRVLLPEREVDHPLGCHRSAYQIGWSSRSCTERKWATWPMWLF